MKIRGVFEIMGPVMVGPSSSHTAGAARLGSIARSLCLMKYGEPTNVVFELYGSFAETYKGHGTDKALLAGIMGMEPGDTRLRQSYEIAKDRGLIYRFKSADSVNRDTHPNTVRFHITCDRNSKQVMTVTGCSIGGGSVIITEIDGLETAFTGEKPLLITRHRDAPGVISKITALLYQRMINIGNMRVKRAEHPEKYASMYLELEEPDEHLIKHLDGLAEEVSTYAGVESALLLRVDR